MARGGRVDQSIFANPGVTALSSLLIPRSLDEAKPAKLAARVKLSRSRYIHCTRSTYIYPLDTIL